MTANTPGPWEVRDNHPTKACFNIVCVGKHEHDHGAEIAVVYRAFDDATHIANAKLIAAAPALADALEGLTQAARDLLNFPRSTIAPAMAKEALVAADAALRAAGRLP